MGKTPYSAPLNELQSKLKQKYPQLTDADLQIKQISIIDMLQMIGYRLRKTKHEMSRIIHFL